MTQYKLSSLPERLIDVGATSADTVHLVSQDESTRGSDRKYLILTYRWGRSNDLAKTTYANFERRLRQIEVSNLLKRIGDAIDLTRNMNVRYPLADAICIIQMMTRVAALTIDQSRYLRWENTSRMLYAASAPLELLTVSKGSSPSEE